MSVIVTGGAGFIGSCLVRMLNDMGIDDILIVDHIGSTEKWRNLVGKRYCDYIPRDEFRKHLDTLKGSVSQVIHMGACSSTTEKDFDFLYQNNFEFSKRLWNFCTEEQIPFFYASSAATYGAGEQGFDDRKAIDGLKPLNGYGYSKQLFDLWVQRQKNNPPQYAGFKFFNVYGPNEYWKGTMASVIYHAYHQIKENGEVGLFRSYREDFPDGGQKRDFIYVKDLCRVMRFFMEHREVSGIFNLGTGTARTFTDLALATFRAMGKEPRIQYVEMPETIREKYQYYTEADMEKLRKAGYEAAFYTLEEGCRDYVEQYLNNDVAVW